MQPLPLFQSDASFLGTWHQWLSPSCVYIFCTTRLPRPAFFFWHFMREGGTPPPPPLLSFLRLLRTALALPVPESRHNLPSSPSCAPSFFRVLPSCAGTGLCSLSPSGPLQQDFPGMRHLLFFSPLRAYVYAPLLGSSLFFLAEGTLPFDFFFGRFALNPGVPPYFFCLFLFDPFFPQHTNSTPLFECLPFPAAGYRDLPLFFFFFLTVPFYC